MKKFAIQLSTRVGGPLGRIEDRDGNGLMVPDEYDGVSGTDVANMLQHSGPFHAGDILEIVEVDVKD